jgi:hypothetical protein
MKTISMLVAVMMAAGALVLPLSMSTANADTLCKFTKDNQRCDLDIARLNGPFKLSIINEQNNNGGGSSGNVSTVDQQARNDIAANGAADAQNVVRADGITSNVTALQGLVREQATTIQQLKTDLQTLNASVITGISLSNGSGVVTPPEPVVCEPPAVLNSTTNQCETPIVVEPPTNDTGNGGGNNTGNGSDTGGNFTG